MTWDTLGLSFSRPSSPMDCCVSGVVDRHTKRLGLSQRPHPCMSEPKRPRQVPEGPDLGPACIVTTCSLGRLCRWSVTLCLVTDNGNNSTYCQVGLCHSPLSCPAASCPSLPGSGVTDGEKAPPAPHAGLPDHLLITHAFISLAFVVG